MQILENLEALLADLSPASFRGIEFHMPDSQSETGRRIQRFAFPGRDDVVHQDLGALDGPIRVRALIVGDDYIRRARRLRAACRQPGPGTLRHPWWGDMQVVVADPASITFDTRQMRVATVEITFEQWVVPPLPMLDTLSRLLDMADEIRAEARAMLRSVLAPLALPLAIARTLLNFASAASGYWTHAMAMVSGNSLLQAEMTPAVQTLAEIADLPADAALADAVDVRLAAAPAAVSAAALVPPEPAVGPGGTAAAATIADGLIGQDQAALPPRRALELLLTVSAALEVTSSVPLPQLWLAAQCHALASAVSVASDIDYESQQDALATRARLDAAIAACASSAAVLATVEPLAVGPVWRSLGRLRAAVAADLSARAGRLPVVTTLTPPAVVSAWLVAQHVAGDNPGRLVALLQDTLTRNGIRRPWAVPAAPLEILP